METLPKRVHFVGPVMSTKLDSYVLFTDIHQATSEAKDTANKTGKMVEVVSFRLQQTENFARDPDYTQPKKRKVSVSKRKPAARKPKPRRGPNGRFV